MKKVRFAVSFILSLLLMFLLVMLQISLFSSSTLLNEKFYINTYERVGVYDYVEESINKGLENIGRTVNLPEELFSGLTNGAWIKDQVDYTTTKTIEYMMYKTDKLPEIDVAKQAEAFNKSLDEYTKKLNLTLEKTALDEINNIKKNVETIVKSQASFIDLSSIGKSAAFQKGRKVLYYAYEAKDMLYVALFINAVLIFLVNIKNIYDAARWTGYSIIAGGLMTLVPAAIGILSDFADSISMSEAILKSFISSILKASMKGFILSGAILFALGALVTITLIFLESGKTSKNLSN